MPKLLLQVPVRGLCYSLVSPIEEGGLTEAREDENNIIISDSKLHFILPPQIKKNTTQ